MDHRTEGKIRADHSKENSFDEKEMTLRISYEDEDGEEVTIILPAKYEVCETCNGKGKHVHAGIDSHGISADEFAEDPDFRDDYYSGRYDVSCDECNGNRVVPEVHEDALTEDQREAYERYLYERNMDMDCDMIAAAERRMGA